MKTRGCNGLSYVLDFANEAAKLDEIVEQDGESCIIHCKLTEYLI